MAIWITVVNFIMTMVPVKFNFFIRGFAIMKSLIIIIKNKYKKFSNPSYIKCKSAPLSRQTSLLFRIHTENQCWFPSTNRYLTRKHKGKYNVKETVPLNSCLLFIQNFSPDCASGNVCEKQHSCHKWGKIKPDRRKIYAQKNTVKSNSKKANKAKPERERNINTCRATGP